MVEALPAHRTQEAFAHGIQNGSARRELHLARRAIGYGGEPLPEVFSVVSNEVRRAKAERRGFAKLLGEPSVSGMAGRVWEGTFLFASDLPSAGQASRRSVPCSGPGEECTPPTPEGQ
jgi:hypothetical protein